MVPRVRVARAAQADDDEIPGGHNRHKLRLVADGMQGRRRKPRISPGVLGRDLQPEMRAIPPRLVGGCRRSGVVDPSRREDSGAVPDAIPKVQHPESGPVACRRVHVRRPDERAGGVGLQHGARHARRVEEGTFGKARYVPRSFSTLRIATAMMLLLAFEYSQRVPGAKAVSRLVTNVARSPTPNSIRMTSERGLSWLSSKRRPLLIRRSWSSVIPALGSPGRCHSGIGAGASTVSRPSRTRTPTSAFITLLETDHPASGVSGLTPAA